PPPRAVALPLAMAGFQAPIGALNDNHDRSDDEVAKPWKPLPAGRVTFAAARATALGGGLLGFLLSAAAGAGARARGRPGWPGAGAVSAGSHRRRSWPSSPWSGWRAPRAPAGDASGLAVGRPGADERDRVLQLQLHDGQVLGQGRAIHLADVRQRRRRAQHGDPLVAR